MNPVLSLFVIFSAALGWVFTWCALRRTGIAFPFTIATCVVLAINTAVLAALASLSRLAFGPRTLVALVIGHLALALTAAALSRTSVADARRALRLSVARWPDPLVGGLVLLIGVLLMQVLLYTPTGHDSMAYHFPKVAHLLDTGSVAPFASQYPHVNETPWGYSYFAFTLLALFGEQFMARLGIVQLIGLVASLATLYWIVRDVCRDGDDDGHGDRRSGRRALVVVTLVAACSPMALLQGSSSRNDLVATAFCLLMVRGAIAVVHARRNPGELVGGLALVGFGAAGTLAVKPNLVVQGALFAAAMLIAHGPALLHRCRSGDRAPSGDRRRSWTAGLCLVPAIIGLSLPFVQATASNLATYGRLTGPAGDQVAGELPSPTDALCRVTLTLGWEARVADPARSFGAEMLRWFSALEQHSLEHLSAVCGDERDKPSNNSTPWEDPFTQAGTDGNEDNQSSPMQLHLLVLSVGLLLVSAGRVIARRRRGVPSSPAWPFVNTTLLCALISLVISSALFPWQYFSNSRFLLPIWMTSSTLTLTALSLVLERSIDRARHGRALSARWVAVGLVVLAAAQSSWTVANNAYSPLPPAAGWDHMPRSDDWTSYARAGMGADGVTPPIAEITAVIDSAESRQCGVIGVTDVYVWRFPLWLAAREAGIRVIDVFVDNPSGDDESAADRDSVCLFFGPDSDVPADVDPARAESVPYGWKVW